VNIGFNPQYLQEALKVLEADTVRLELKDGSKPGVVREGNDFLYVLMPVNPKD
jgi:DNA polymerase III sliding clamp (beta) subunit (PCNA family)